MKTTLSFVALYLIIFANTLSPALALEALTANATEVSAVAGVGPILDCIEVVGPNSYIARFGYQNTTGGTINIPVGPNNYFRFGAANQGQVTSFQPGRVVDAFRVPFTRTITWVLTGPDGLTQSATATPSSQLCGAPTPTPTPNPTPIQALLRHRFLLRRPVPQARLNCSTL